MTTFGFVILNDFRCNVIGCPTNGFAFFVAIVDAGGQSQITDLDVQLLVEKQIAQFEIPVNDILVVQVLDCIQQMSHVVCGFGFRQSFATFEQFIQTLIVTQLQQDVTILLVFKEMFEFAHVRMLQRAMDFDLGLQLVEEEEEKNRRLLE